MTEIERKALELVNEVEREEIYKDFTSIHKKDIILNAALHRAIEQHEAFRQEVSDVVGGVVNSTYMPAPSEHKLRRFIITKPDPLVEAVKDILDDDSMDNAEEFSEAIRAALAKRGLEIREKSDD